MGICHFKSCTSHLIADILIFFLFVKQKDEIFKVLHAERRGEINRVSQEYVVITCCAPEVNNLNPKYVNKSAAILTLAQLTPDTTYDESSLLGMHLLKKQLFFVYFLQELT